MPPKKSSGPSKSSGGGKHRLVWYEGRNTPKVTTPGKTPKPSANSNKKVVKSRMATAEEEKKIAKGQWLRVDKNGNTPSSKTYGTGSSVRPQFNKHYGKRKGK